MATDFRDVVIRTFDDDELEVTVVVGDGKTIYDENFEYDYRVYYYFHDESEFDKAWNPSLVHGITEDFDFTILKYA